MLTDDEILIVLSYEASEIYVASQTMVSRNPQLFCSEHSVHCESGGTVISQGIVRWGGQLLSSSHFISSFSLWTQLLLGGQVHGHPETGLC